MISIKLSRTCRNMCNACAWGFTCHPNSAMFSNSLLWNGLQSRCLDVSDHCRIQASEQRGGSNNEGPSGQMWEMTERCNEQLIRMQNMRVSQV